MRVVEEIAFGFREGQPKVELLLEERHCAGEVCHLKEAIPFRGDAGAIQSSLKKRAEISLRQFGGDFPFRWVARTCVSARCWISPTPEIVPHFLSRRKGVGEKT